MAIFADLVRCSFVSRLSTGQAVVNTFYLRRTSGSGGTPDIATLGGLATDISTFFGAAYRATLPTSATLDHITTYQVVDPTTVDIGAEYNQPVGSAGTHTAGSPNSPQSACAILQFKSPSASRRFRGHIFLAPALDATALAGDNWSVGNAYYVAITALGVKFSTGATSPVTWTGSSLANWSLALYSKRAALSGDPSVAGVTLVTPSPKVRWLRSRELGTS